MTERSWCILENIFSCCWNNKAVLALEALIDLSAPDITAITVAWAWAADDFSTDSTILASPLDMTFAVEVSLSKFFSQSASIPNSDRSSKSPKSNPARSARSWSSLVLA